MGLDDPTRQGSRVLVIDDTDAVRRTTISQLQMLGFEACGAEDGLRGLEEVSRDRPDVVLCDLRMPRMDGLAFLAVMRDQQPNLPVVVMSGAGLVDDAVGALQLGAWDYVVKPVPSTALGHSLRRVLERARLIDENRRYRAHLEEVNRELRASLRLLADDEAAGRQIQVRMLPANHQRFGPFEFSREIVPSAFLSGDFVDAFSIDERRWGFYLADVSGHGVPSALVTVLLRTFVQRHVADFVGGGDDLVTSPARLLKRLNEEVLREGLEKHSTMFFGIIDNVDGSLLYANAGQFPWPLVHDGERTTALAEPGMPLGLAARTEYVEHRVALPEEGVLAVFSDGLLEILPHDSLAAKLDFLAALFGRADVTVEKIVGDLRLHDRAPLPDDIAMLLIKRGGGHDGRGDPARVLRA